MIMEFKVKDARATVRAANVNATIEAFKTMPTAGQWLIERHGIDADNLHPDTWVEVTKWMAALKDLRERCGSEMLRQVGRVIINNANFPPQFDSVEMVLMSLDRIYYLNHRGDVGHYVCKSDAAGVVSVSCETPYPAAFERGLIEGISKHPALTRGASYRIDYEEGSSTSDRTCSVMVRRIV